MCYLQDVQDGEIEGVRLAGLVAQRYALDEKYLYVTFSVMGKNAYILENGYSCDGGSKRRTPYLLDALQRERAFSVR